MKRRPLHSESGRDQEKTAFGVILDNLLRIAPGAIGAAVVDPIGETVDYSGRLSPFDIKVAAAHLQIVLEVARSRGTAALGSPVQIDVRAHARGYMVRPLLEGYALVVLLARGVLWISPRALAFTERALCHEAGWSMPPQVPPVWHSVEVQTSERGHRPMSLRAGSEWERVTVLGTVVGLRRARGYRIRLGSGAELTLVREPLGNWFADEPVGRADGSGVSRGGAAR